MSLWQSIVNIVTFQEPKKQEPFELLETSEDNLKNTPQAPAQNKPNNTDGENSQSAPATNNDQGSQDNQSQQNNQKSKNRTSEESKNQPDASSEGTPHYRLARRPVRPQKAGDPVTENIVKKVYDIMKQKQENAQENSEKKSAGVSGSSSGSKPSQAGSTQANSSETPPSSNGHRQHRQRMDAKTASSSGSDRSSSSRSSASSGTNDLEGGKSKNQKFNRNSKSGAKNQDQNQNQGRSQDPDQKKSQANANGSNASNGGDPNQDLSVYPDLEQNLIYLAETFYWPTDTSLILREFVVGTTPPIPAIAVYIEGLADPGRLNQAILEPLMLLSQLNSEESNVPQLSTIKQRLLSAATVQTKEKLYEIVENICAGSTAIFFQGIPQALIVETSGWPRRGVEQPVSERVIRGPQEGFNEDMAANTSMVRHLLRDPMLVKEVLKVGLRAHNQCSLLYIQDLANPALIKEIKRRIQSLAVDAVLSSGAMEQLIEDNSWGLYPLSMSTERPDRVVAALLDGKAAVLLDGDPFALIYPTEVWSLLHAAEDSSTPSTAASILRFFRWLAAGLLLFLPGMYLAIVGFHQEMLPTDLLISIAANRERVPFPSVVEVLLMEIAFELIREAGVRIPGVIGPTLGIVGAIILGQAAVAANLVNPIVIVIVAITGISAFAIPSYSLTLTLRVYRFFYIFLGSTLGLLGMAVGVTVEFITVVSLKSMGVPYLSPLGPFTRANKDILTRGMLWNQERRLDYIGGQDQYRQAPIARKWILNSGNSGREKRK